MTRGISRYTLVPTTATVSAGARFQRPHSGAQHAARTTCPHTCTINHTPIRSETTYNRFVICTRYTIDVPTIPVPSQHNCSIAISQHRISCTRYNIRVFSLSGHSLPKSGRPHRPDHFTSLSGADQTPTTPCEMITKKKGKKKDNGDKNNINLT